ncbi:glycosyl transferase, UDP-glucuronosyltransferase [Beggiatoa alba B18LD]|uniref:Glycosyl transferase, UDP-glucuronosyltransferase n=1 Tax=Beggiatoa alba B18LD TaxID=395493 RepID=I3CI91_9GAMM|nr:glycosyltransferase [Beggiatoa alba]EIJ43334.1 glycosyl transferase, UDP-glucuronosyltransferase [Beggiatoa alba B18LD]
MAIIVISSSGTHGDHLPYIALGVALQQRGHCVRMAVRKSMHDYVIGAGLEAVDCGAELSEELAREKASDWDEWQMPQISSVAHFESTKARFQTEFPIVFRTLVEICVDADLFICGLQRHLFGAMLAQKFQLPWLAASVTPFFQCSEQNTQETQAIRKLFIPTLNEISAQLGIKQALNWLEYEKNEWALLGSSSHFAQTISRFAHYRQTGFWFYQAPSWSTWQPDETLRQFVEGSDKPLYLTFSSIPVVDPQKLLMVHVRAAEKLGRRLIVQRGCANFNESLLSDNCDAHNVKFVDFMPQDWLLTRTAVILHHGGIGTIARALHHDCPMVIEPLGNDQFFNAQRVLSLGIGAAMHPHKITVDGLARVLETKVLTEETRYKTQLLGEKIRAEKGLVNACQFIESIHERH